MSAYIKLATLEYPRHEGDIRLEHPEIGEEFICPDTYASVEWVDPPEHDEARQAPYEVAPVKDAGGWKMAWALREFSTQEIEARAAAFGKHPE